MSTGSSYWCYRCNRLVRLWNQDSVTCPDCSLGFVEAIENPARSSLSESRRRRFPAAAMYMMRNSETNPGSNSGPSPAPGLISRPALRRSRRNGGDRSPFNPVIVLRGASEGGNTAAAASGVGGGFEMYYDDGSGSGLRPLPSSMSDFLLGSGFDRLLDQLAQIEANGIGRLDNPPASKAAIDSMPTVEIDESHITTESHCAVCKEAFELGSDAREMPCKHLYHSGCILPWLSLRNSCPVCRRELPTETCDSCEPNRVVNEPNDVGNADEAVGLTNEPNDVGNADEAVGLTIWRLPGGGFAVGRFSGGRRNGERELPLVYTEMDGGFNNNGLPRRISWGSRGGVSDQRGGFRRALRGLFSCFRGVESLASSSAAESRVNRPSNNFSSVFSSGTRRRYLGFEMGGRRR